MMSPASGERVEDVLELVGGSRPSSGGAHLGHDLVPFRHENGLAGLDEAQILGESRFELLDADRLHTTPVR